MSTRYRHLSMQDRVEIEKLLDAGQSQAQIARVLGCHRSTVSREVRRGSWSPESSHANLRPYLRNKLNTRPPRERLYLAHQAHHQAVTRGRASHRPYRMEYDGLVDHVLSRFRSGWTPEEISGRLPIDFPDNPRMRVSPETLYSWVYSPRMRSRALWQYLPRGHKKRRIRGGRRVHQRRIRWRVGIDQRPVEVMTRDQFGHWESDSVIGKNRANGLHTTVERTSRFLQARRLHQVTAGDTVTAQKNIYAQLPAHAVSSVTVDNGSEFAHHYRLADSLGVPTYFCDPYSAWQRGTNEHFNERLRRYFPKGTNFDDVTDSELQDIVSEINNRPRKVLGFATPAEIFQELCSNPPHP